MIKANDIKAETMGVIKDNVITKDIERIIKCAASHGRFDTSYHYRTSSDIRVADLIQYFCYCGFDVKGIPESADSYLLNISWS